MRRKNSLISLLVVMIFVTAKLKWIDYAKQNSLLQIKKIEVKRPL